MQTSVGTREVFCRNLLSQSSVESIRYGQADFPRRARPSTQSDAQARLLCVCTRWIVPKIDVPSKILFPRTMVSPFSFCNQVSRCLALHVHLARADLHSAMESATQSRHCQAAMWTAITGIIALLLPCVAIVPPCEPPLPQPLLWAKTLFNSSARSFVSS